MPFIALRSVFHGLNREKSPKIASAQKVLITKNRLSSMDNIQFILWYLKKSVLEMYREAALMSDGEINEA